jgi:hypothetical protein
MKVVQILRVHIRIATSQITDSRGSIWPPVTVSVNMDSSVGQVCPLYQQPYALGVCDRISGVLVHVAGWAQQLDVAPVVRAAVRDGDYVVDVIAASDVCAAVGTFATL